MKAHVLVLLLALVSGSCFASALDGSAAFTLRDYKTAFKEALPLAKQGNSRAQAVLGLLYWDGVGGANKDYKTSVAWFKKAAMQGDATGQYGLGNAYYLGYVVPKDYRLAFFLGTQVGR